MEATFYLQNYDTLEQITSHSKGEGVEDFVS